MKTFLATICLLGVTTISVANPPPQTDKEYEDYYFYKESAVGHGPAFFDSQDDSRAFQDETFSGLRFLGVEHLLDEKVPVHILIDAFPKTFQGKHFSYGDVGYYFVSFRNDTKLPVQFKLFDYNQEYYAPSPNKFGMMSIGDYGKEFITFSIRLGDEKYLPEYKQKQNEQTHYFVYDRVHERIYDIGEWGQYQVLVSDTQYNKGLIMLTIKQAKLDYTDKTPDKIVMQWVIDTNYQSKFVKNINWTCYKPNKKPTDGNEECPLHEIEGGVTTPPK